MNAWSAANLFFAGLLAGEELVVCYGLRPVLSRFDAALQIPVRQALIRRLRILVPILLVAALLSGIAARATAAGLAALLAFLAVTLTGTVPINKAALAWNASLPPAEWRDAVRRWGRLDVIRCWLALAAFALFLAATGSAA